MTMQGLGIKSLKKNPALIPLYICVGAGAVAAVLMSIRSAIKNPDVAWKRGTNPEPWQEYKEKQFKFFSPIRDYSKVKSLAPEYKD